MFNHRPWKRHSCRFRATGRGSDTPVAFQPKPYSQSGRIAASTSYNPYRRSDTLVAFQPKPYNQSGRIAASTKYSLYRRSDTLVAFQPKPYKQSGRIAASTRYNPYRRSDTPVAFQPKPYRQSGRIAASTVSSKRLIDGLEEVFDLGGGVVAVELCDHIESDAFGADCLAFADVGATAEAFVVHGADHHEGAAVFFDLTLREAVHVGDFGGGKEHRGSVGTGGDAGATTDTGGGIHRGVGGLFWNGNGVGIDGATGAGGDEAAGLDDAVEGTAIDDEVFDDGQGLGAPGLDGDGLAVFEMAHVELAGGGLLLGTVGDAVDGEGAHPADAFAAIVIKGEGFLSLCYEVLTEEVEHFEKGGILGDVVELVIFEAALVEGAFLTPNAKV